MWGRIPGRYFRWTTTIKTGLRLKIKWETPHSIDCSFCWFWRNSKQTDTNRSSVQATECWRQSACVVDLLVSKGEPMCVDVSLELVWRTAWKLYPFVFWRVWSDKTPLNWWEKVKLFWPPFKQTPDIVQIVCITQTPQLKNGFIRLFRVSPKSKRTVNWLWGFSFCLPPQPRLDGFRFSKISPGYSPYDGRSIWILLFGLVSYSFRTIWNKRRRISNNSRTIIFDGLDNLDEILDKL